MTSAVSLATPAYALRSIVTFLLRLIPAALDSLIRLPPQWIYHKMASLQSPNQLNQDESQEAVLRVLDEERHLRVAGHVEADM